MSAEKAPLMPAVVEEQFDVDQVQAVTQDDGTIMLRLLAGPINEGAAHLACRSGRMNADLAIIVGEYLAKEGRKLKSGLHVVGGLEVPAV